MLKSVSICDISFDIFVLEDQNIRLVPRQEDQAHPLPRITELIIKAKETNISDAIATHSEIMIFGTDINFKKLSKLHLSKEENSTPLILPLYLKLNDDLKHFLKSKSLSLTAFESILDQVDLKISHFGFIPGFLYIDGLPNALHIPRKSNPSQSCPPRSIAIGGPYLGFYNYPSPAGWYIIGQSPVEIKLDEFDVLSIGRHVQLKRLDLDEYDNILAKKLTLKTYNAED